MSSLPPRRKPQLATEPAQTLAGLNRTLLDQPLRNDEWDLYAPEVNAARGEDAVQVLANEFLLGKGGAFVKRFFSGNVACGKSTEITRLINWISSDYECVRIDVRDWVSNSSVEPQDLLFSIIFALSDAMADAQEKYELQAEPDRELVKRLEFLTKETEYVAKDQKLLEGQVGFKDISVLGAKFAASAKTSQTFTVETREKQRLYLSDLLTLANEFLAQCYDILHNTPNELEWLIVIEELDKSPNLAKLKETLSNDALFMGLEAHLVCNIPSAARVGDALCLPQVKIYDVAVYDEYHRRHEQGVEAIRAALSKRADAHLFSEHQVDRLVIASGGNLRTLFRMVQRAAMLAYSRLQSAGAQDPDQGPIETDDATRAINAMRAEYRDRLGESFFGDDDVTIEQKVERLISIYDRKPNHDVLDRVLSSLLKAGAVQIYNGKVRHAVHPLVVDILNEWQRIEAVDGKVPGGLLLPR